MDLDSDDDFEVDEVKSFLLNKLDEIKLGNVKLGVTLQERRQLLKGVMESCTMRIDDIHVSISKETWKKVFNNKYILGVTVENNDSRNLQNVKIILKWDSPSPLLYQVLLYEENRKMFVKKTPAPLMCTEGHCDNISDSLKKSEKIDKYAHLVVVLNQPKFTEKLVYTITGNVIFQRDNQDITLMFPSVEISPLDATSHFLNYSILVKGENKDILSVMSCSEITPVVVILPEDWNSSIDSTFEILCSLNRVNIQSECRKFYMTYKLSPCFDDSLLICHAPKGGNMRIYDLDIYSRNGDCLLALLHHLHQNISGAVIIPKALYENYTLRHPEDTNKSYDLNKFKECIHKEINFVSKFLQNYQHGSDVKNVIKFRSDLSDIENNTDLYYLRICQANFRE